MRRSPRIGIGRACRPYVLIMAIVLSPLAASAQTNCWIYFSDYNSNRKIYGNVAAECPGSIHTHPWGNWGVEANHGSRYNGYQFAGWHSGGDWLEWNSCTTHYDYSPPNPSYFNWDDYTTQFSPDEYGYAVWSSGEVPWPCSDYGPIFTVGGYWMDLYELDPWCCDEYVATLGYPNFNLVISGSPGYYAGWSDWIDPSSSTSTYGDVLTAKIRVLMELIDVGGVNAGPKSDSSAG